MKLDLKISLPRNLTVTSLLEQRNIPCFCKIGGSFFELAFQAPLPAVAGEVIGWNAEVIDERAPARGGGSYTHYCFAMVTLKQLGTDIYRIFDLYFFNEISGWCPIIIDEALTLPRQNNSQEEIDEIESLFKDKKLSKKQKGIVGSRGDKEDGGA